MLELYESAELLELNKSLVTSALQMMKAAVQTGADWDTLKTHVKMVSAGRVLGGSSLANWECLSTPPVN